MADHTLLAEPRTEFGKGAARRIRRANQIPAVLYGHGIDPIHLALPGHATMLALRTTNALLSIKIDGETKTALARQVQRDPLTTNIEHVDLLLIRKGEKVVVEVALVITGTPAPDGMVMSDQQSISLEVPATDIPEQIELSVEGLEIGTQLFAKDLALPANAAYQGDGDDLLVSVNAPGAEDLGSAADGAAGADATTGENAAG